MKKKTLEQQRILWPWQKQVYIMLTKGPGWVRAALMLLWDSGSVMMVRQGHGTKVIFDQGLGGYLSAFSNHTELLSTWGNWHYEISLDQKEVSLKCKENHRSIIVMAWGSTHRKSDNPLETHFLAGLPPNCCSHNIPSILLLATLLLILCRLHQNFQWLLTCDGSKCKVCSCRPCDFSSRRVWEITEPSTTA